jgi:hypothetical protein
MESWGTVGAILRIKKETPVQEPLVMSMDVDTQDDSIPDEDVSHRPDCVGDGCSCFYNVSMFPSDENYDGLPKKINKEHYDHYLLTAAHCVFSKLKMTDSADDVEMRNQLSQNALYTVYDHSMDAALLPVENHSDTNYHVRGTRVSDWSAQNYRLDQKYCVFKVGATTGITFGTLTAVNVKVEECYESCIEVTSRSDAPFCRRGDSGSVYYLIDRFDDYKIIPIAIHRTSKGNKSYGSDLKLSVLALMKRMGIDSKRDIEMV